MLCVLIRLASYNFQYKKENHPKLSEICSYGFCTEGLKNEFETHVVIESSVFEALTFYCKSKILINEKCFV